MTERFWGIAAALLSVFFGSTYSIFSKYLLQFTIPETLILVSQLFALISILLFFGLVPELKDIRKLDKKSLLSLFAVACCSSIIGPLLYMKGLSDTSAINVIVTSRISSIFVGVLGFIRLKEVFTWQWLYGTLLMFLGIVCITTKGFGGGFQIDTGVIYVVGSAIASAVGSVVYKKFLYHVKPEVVLLVRYALACFVFISLVPFMLHINHEVSIGFQENTWIYFLGLALIPLLASTYLWYEALDHLPANLVGALDLLVPFSGMILAYIFLHEGLYMYHMWGGILLILGLGINLMKNLDYMSSGMMKRILLFRRT